MPVPDDARDLVRDRGGRFRRLLLTRRWQRFGLSGPIVSLFLLATGGVGALAVLLGPRPATPPPGPAAPAAVRRIDVPAVGARPTGPAPTVEPVGDLVGRRLPQVLLAADLSDVSTDTLRPAVVLLVPPDCDCATAVDEVYRQAREFRLSTWLIAAGGPDRAGTAATRRALDALDRGPASGGARWAVDLDAVLARALRARGLSVALVRADGVVTALLRDVPPDGRGLPAMEIALAGLAPRR